MANATAPVPHAPRLRGALLLFAALALTGAAAAQETKAAPTTPESEAQAKLQKQVDKLVRDLELPARRAAAFTELEQLGARALPGLRTALAAEEKRARPEIAGLVRYALMAAELTVGKLTFGLPEVPVTSVADFTANRVLFLDGKGATVKTVANTQGVWDAALTPQGTLLVCEFSKGLVREIDGKDNTVWQFDEAKNPYRASRLANGNTLIADSAKNRVIEVDAAKKVVWEYDKDIRPFDCARLPDGNTLIADSLNNRVLEVDRKGEVVWEAGKLENVHSAQRLPSGNTLVTLRAGNRVVEVDKEGKEVWHVGELNSPCQAVRLPNGNTLVGGGGGIREFDQGGKEVWSKAMQWAVGVRRY